MYGEKTIVSVTSENVRISIIKVHLILHKMCGRLSCVVHGPIYSRFIYSRFSLYRGTQRQFSENISTIQPLYTVFRMLCNNADARRCSYFKHGLPVVFLKRISSFWAEHFKDIFRMISQKHPVNKFLINLIDVIEDFGVQQGSSVRVFTFAWMVSLPMIFARKSYKACKTNSRFCDLWNVQHSSF